MSKLEIELIPQSTFSINVRSNVTDQDWDRIRHKCYDEASDKCEICGDNGLNQGHGHKVECHEIWEFDNDKRVQLLTGFIALCPRCHKSKHYGYARVSGQEAIVRKHLQKVNGWDVKQLDEHIDMKFEEWKERSCERWKVDISYKDEYISDVGVTKLDRIFKKIKGK